MTTYTEVIQVDGLDETMIEMSIGPYKVVKYDAVTDYETWECLSKRNIRYYAKIMSGTAQQMDLICFVREIKTNS